MRHIPFSSLRRAGVKYQRVFSYLVPFTQNSKETLGKVKEEYQTQWITRKYLLPPPTLIFEKQQMCVSHLHHHHTLVTSGSVCWSSNPSTALFPNKPAVL